MLAKTLASNSSKQAIIEKIKQTTENLNNELYKKQQELVKVRSEVERLQGEKNLISERSKYDSKDLKVHDNILLLKEKLLGINNEISTLELEIENENTNNKTTNDKLNNIVEKLKEIEKIKESHVTELNNNIHNLTALKHRRDVLIDSIENNSSFLNSK